jgi:transposase
LFLYSAAVNFISSKLIAVSISVIHPQIFQESVVFLDNATIHKSKIVKDNLDSKVLLLFNAPYTPVLNPAEEFFAYIKQNLRKNPNSSENELTRSLASIINNMSIFLCKRLILHSLSYCENILNMKDV